MSVSIANKQLSVEVLESGGTAITDLRTRHRWVSDLGGWVTIDGVSGVERLPLELASTPKTGPDHLLFSLKTNRGGVSSSAEVSIDVRLSLAGGPLDIEIVGVLSTARLVSIEYPARLFSIPSGAAGGYLAVPFKQGVVVPSRLDAGFMRFMHNAWRNIADVERTLPFESGALNMPWFGAHLSGSAMFAHVRTAADCSLHVIGNAVVNGSGEVVDARQGKNPGERISCFGVVWSAEHGKLGYTRSLRIEPVQNGYVGMAKRYRSYSKEVGRFVSLEDKVKGNPLAERIIGAPDIKIYIYTNRPNTPYFRSWSDPVLNGYSKTHTTFDQVASMSADLKGMGIDRALLLLGGWNRAGYDREHVDMWPPAESAGGAAALKRAASAAASSGFLFSLHDNYQDIYTEAPSYTDKCVMKHVDGSLQVGGTWDGGLCRLVCSSQAFVFAERNLDLVTGSVPISSYYLDTTTAAHLYECYDPTHPLTRSEDRSNKLELLRSLSRRGLIVGGEGGTDWAVPVCSFFEGLPGSSIGQYTGIESADFGLVAPLFNLVYHDAVVCYWQHGQPFGREDHVNHVLHDLMSGQPSSWSLVYDQWEDLKGLIKETYELLSRFHRITAYHEMVSHEFLSEDFTVHRTHFSDGSEVIVNFGIVTAQVDGNAIAPKGFWVHSPGQPEKTGALSRSIVYSR